MPEAHILYFQNGSIIDLDSEEARIVQVNDVKAIFVTERRKGIGTFLIQTLAHVAALQRMTSFHIRRDDLTVGYSSTQSSLYRRALGLSGMEPLIFPEQIPDDGIQNWLEVDTAVDDAVVICNV